jgi:hypothetical protein
MSETPNESIYRSRSFYQWKVSVQASYASNSAWAARWYAEKAAELAALEAAPPEAQGLAKQAKEAAWHAARDAGIASAEFEKCRAGEIGSHSLAWERARIAAGWCAEAESHLKWITELLEKGSTARAGG